MIVIGISPLDKDATVSLMIDGKLVCAIAEERLSRKKMHAGFPRLALEAALEQAGVDPQDVDCVAYAFFDADKETQLMHRNDQRDYQLNRQPPSKPLSRLIREARQRVTRRDVEIAGLGDPMETMQKPWHKRLMYQVATSDGYLGAYNNYRQFKQWLNNASSDHHKYQRELVAGLSEFGLEQKLQRVEHHESHVANAFYCSGFERALAFTVDAYGSGLSATVSIVDDQGIERISGIETPYSLGTMYEYVTSALGFNPDRHAGKIVGLAAYGDPKILGEVLHSLFVWDGPVFRIRRSSDVYLARYLSTIFPKIDLAAAYQTVLEEVVTRYLEHFVNETGIDTVVMSGGVAANVKLNQRVHELANVRNIYIHPGMGDGGCGTGAAILKTLEAGVQPERLDSVYQGPEYSDAQLKESIENEGLEYTHCDDIETEIAGLIADNYVVARFNGRMEYGPRALGNRSILYPAQDPEVNQWLNHRLGRTEFMPFAPATLYEDRSECYLNTEGAEFTAQFMTITFDCTPQMKQQCPAAVHVDGTARPQFVTRESNPSFYRILKEYKKLTGISSVINTSFNMHEEPIVCTPGDAIRAFTLGHLDYLAMGDFLVRSTDLEGNDRRGGRRKTNRNKREMTV